MIVAILSLSLILIFSALLKAMALVNHGLPITTTLAAHLTDDFLYRTFRFRIPELEKKKISLCLCLPLSVFHE